MSIRNLDPLFEPRSVVVIGASTRATSVGGTVWRNLATGRFAGPLYGVNPKYQEINGRLVVARVQDLPEVPDLAVICTPAASVPSLIEQLGRLGTRAAVVLTAGLTPEQKQAMLDAARPHLLRILGPNCIGLLSPHSGLNASFAHIDATPGGLAFVSQSGALVTAVLDWARGRQVGFSHFASLGEHADVDFGDMLDYLASDAKTRAILLYIESIEQPQKFMSAARAAARNKPVIVVKAGRSSQGQKAAASHTGALAGSDMVYDAAICRAGMLRVDTLQDLFMAAETLTRFRGNQGERLAILTNGGGAGVMAADAAAAEGVGLCELSPATLQRLNEVLPANWSRGNPVDIIGDAPAERYVNALKALYDDPDVGAVLFIQAPTAIVPSADIAQALLPLSDGPTPRLMSSWLGDAAVASARKIFREAGVPSYFTPEEGVRAFAMGVRYRKNQEQLLQTPAVIGPGVKADTAAARAIIQNVLASGRELLTEPEAKAVLAAYFIPVAATQTVTADADAVVAAAAQVGYPAVLKILSPDISHKSDVGGVALNLTDAQAVRDAAQRMLERVRKERPGARIEGFAVQAMVQRRHAQELILGASIDPIFGPVILFGQGGTAVEVMADRAIALPPLNEPLARTLVAKTRVARLLQGWRDTPAADATALHAAIIGVSHLLADLPELAELDINPLLANHEGVIALDARIRVCAKRPAGAAHFAIRPYPAQLIEQVIWQGRSLTLRPIRPEDEAQHREFLRRLDINDIRMRVFYSRRSIEHSELARLTQIDYAREMAFVAVAPGPDGKSETLGVMRAVADPDNQSAEFGIVVRSDLKGGGLGHLLMSKMLSYLRTQGTGEIVANILTENDAMRAFARRHGFLEQPVPGDHGMVAVVLKL